MLMNIVLLLVGTTLVLWGADKFTDGACGVARRWNVSELMIGLTIVAMGTSLPELIVSLFSSIRGSGDMSVGNIVGSNIFNTLVIIGASAMAMKIAVTRVTLYRDVSLRHLPPHTPQGADTQRCHHRSGTCAGGCDRQPDRLDVLRNDILGVNIQHRGSLGRRLRQLYDGQGG